jgi:hypothetical protein
MTKKLTITENANILSVYTFDTTLESLKTTVDAWVKEYGPSARLNYSEYGFEKYESTPGYRIVVDRLETDAEQDKRVKEENSYRVAVEARDLAEFQRLSEKFKENK